MQKEWQVRSVERDDGTIHVWIVHHDNSSRVSIVTESEPGFLVPQEGGGYMVVDYKGATFPQHMADEVTSDVRGVLRRLLRYARKQCAVVDGRPRDERRPGIIL